MLAFKHPSLSSINVFAITKVMISGMRKIGFIAIFILSAVISLYANDNNGVDYTTDTLYVYADVPLWHGVDDGNTRIKISGGVYLYLKVSDTTQIADWTSTDGDISQEKEVDLIGDGAKAFNIIVGANGNTVSPVSVDVAFEVQGWSKEKDFDNAEPVNGLSIERKVFPSLEEPAGKISSSAEDGILKLTHSTGIQKEIVTAGYTTVSWKWDGITPVDAGKYYAAVIINIDVV